MKNIHVIPTDKPSRLIHNDSNQLCYQSNKSFKNDRKWMYRKKFNIYITSDEEIKEGDWCIDKHNFVYKQETDKIFSEFTGSKKIILTTDTDLIKDGVQAIDDEFLEWFVKNPSYEEVEVETYFKKIGVETDANGYRVVDVLGKDYKIIIPKEEYKQETHICKYCKAETTQSDDQCYAKPKQETLEEAAERIYPTPNPYVMGIDIGNMGRREAFKKGVKWMKERMYSEEEVRRAFQDGQDNMNHSEMYGWSSKLTEQEWFNQFKKNKLWKKNL